MDRRTRRLGAFVILLMVILGRPAHAYIDPGTGSYVLQTVLGILFGLLYAMKIYWGQIVALVRHTFARKQEG